MQLPKYSMGIGDRFGHQGKAQLQALLQAGELGVSVAPVWNKSHREHSIIGTQPADVRVEADQAVAALRYDGPYFVDADHIGFQNVDAFLDASDFFTLDVADFTGEPSPDEDLDAFVDKHADLAGKLYLPGLNSPIEITPEQLRAAAAKYLLAVREAGKIYRRIENRKGAGHFVTEVSMDETDSPQTPAELLLILAAIADEEIPAQTIAPKFTGRFNKGVDYVGDLEQFRLEFEQDLAVIAYAVAEFGLPANQKLSVHSGSDKFSIYKPIGRALRNFDAGLHLKTAGTTWLEELIGLAAAGGDGLQLAKEVYRESLSRMDELCGPYATVIDIDADQLPSADVVAGWTAAEYTQALRHEQSCPSYNPHLRQLLHVAYKVAAKMGKRYLDALKRHESIISENVSTNLFERHLKRIFGTSPETSVSEGVG